MVIAHLFTRPGCHACETEGPAYAKRLSEIGCYTSVFDVTEADGLGEAAWAELIDQPVPALAIWEAGNPHYLGHWSGALPPIEEIERLIEGKI